MNPFPHSNILSFNDLIEYSQGGVISKQVIKAQTGNVTLFSFDAGQGLSEHSAPFDALVQIIEGNARITIGGEPFELIANQSIINVLSIPGCM